MRRTFQPLACRLVMVALFVTCIAASAAAQGRLRGTVRDRDGNGVAHATVGIESGEWNMSREETTDDSGRFSFIGLNQGEWLIVIRADGFEPVQGFAIVRGAAPAVVQFALERDVFNPPAPAAGVLAGLKATEVVERLEEAGTLFDRGEYDGAIDAYRAILERVPAMTSLNLLIGHAFRAKQEPDQALAAYRAVLEADPSNAEARAALDGNGQTVR